MGRIADLVATVIAADQIVVNGDISEDYLHDEGLNVEPRAPEVVVKPSTTAEVAALLRLANDERIPVTARGAGTGLCGSAVARHGGMLLSTERMNAIKEIDEENHVAVVEPGVTLLELDAACAAKGLVYPVYPGELSATLGGNVATNAGGMRAVKYGVTRHQVLGLEAVLPTGEVIRTGGKFVKHTTGFDLTQLIVGSEGTLAIVTEITLRLYPRPSCTQTALVPFSTLEEVTTAVPAIVRSGVGPLILEYVDMMSMAATTANVGLDLGIPQAIKDQALAYLIVVIEGHHEDRVESDIADVAELVSELGALDVYVLQPAAATALLDAREKAFWVAKQHGANDIIDVVVPRASIPTYMAEVAEIASKTGSWVAGAGHAGDGNVHLSVFQSDPEKLAEVMQGILAAGMRLGGTISAEHGIGTEKKAYFLALEDPAKIALQERIKAAFDPHGILNPGVLFA